MRTITLIMHDQLHGRELSVSVTTSVDEVKKLNWTNLERVVADRIMALDRLLDEKIKKSGQ